MPPGPESSAPNETTAPPGRRHRATPRSFPDRFLTIGRLCGAILAWGLVDLRGADPALPSAMGGSGLPRIHDPSTVVRCGDEFWLFSTGVGVLAWRSKDLASWTAGPRVFPTMPAWVTEVVPGQRGHFWAPDIIHLNGRYSLYYSVSSWGKNDSAIALASNVTLDPADARFRWVDEGTVVRSFRTNDLNAIDPSVILGRDGRLWLAFGSFWSGINLLELAAATGKARDPAAAPQAPGLSPGFP